MIYSEELTRWVNFDSFVLATYGSQAYHKASIEAERVSALVKIHETSTWCEGNLADKGSGSYYCYSSRVSGLSKKSNMFSRRIPLSFL